MNENMENEVMDVDDTIEVYDLDPIDDYEDETDSKSVVGGLVALGLTAVAGGVTGYAIRESKARKERTQLQITRYDQLIEMGVITEQNKIYELGLDKKKNLFSKIKDKFPKKKKEDNELENLKNNIEKIKEKAKEA